MGQLLRLNSLCEITWGEVDKAISISAASAVSNSNLKKCMLILAYAYFIKFVCISVLWYSI